MTFRNVYEDATRADAYSRLEFPGTYFLAFRDLPSLCERHVTGRRAVDFGCGAGRSTRLLRALAFEVVGVDVSADMIRRARELDPSGDYRLVEPARLVGLLPGAWDLVLSAFTFDNIPQAEKAAHFAGLEARLAVVTSHEPLGREDEPFAWISETRVASWRIDVLKRA